MPRFSSTPQAHAVRGIAYDTVIRGIRRAQEDAQDGLGIRTQLIMCFLRDMSADSAMATLEQSLPYKDWIIGVGLDADEKGNPPIKFKAVFDRARAEGYRLTMHCDVDQEGLDPAHLADPGRHRGRQDRTTASIRWRRGALRRDRAPGLGAHGLPDFQQVHHRQPQGSRGPAHAEEGNAGDRQLRRSRLLLGYVQENLVATQEEADLSRDQVVRLAANAFEASWLPAQDQRALLDRLEDYAASEAGT